MDFANLAAMLLAFVPADYATYALAVCGLCAVVAALWRRPADGSKWLPLYNLVNACGANFLHARNATSQQAKG